MADDTNSRRFQAGGALGPTALYIEREADQYLIDDLYARQFRLVLAPRQIGKSSLRIRAAMALRARGCRTASVDLTKIGATGTEKQWYFGLIEEIARELSLPDPIAYWERHEHRGAVHCWSRYLRDEVLVKLAEPIIIFIDEIESVLRLSFKPQDFFSSIRTVYNDRADDSSCTRLTFCLLGVAAPDDLMSDQYRTPFNIGREVVLGDIPRERGGLWEEGLRGSTTDEASAVTARKLLDEVFVWTDGHPYMTQVLCEALAATEPAPGSTTTERVAAAVGENFLANPFDNRNLAYAEGRIRLEIQAAPVSKKLAAYREMLDDKRIAVAAADSDDHRIQVELQLAGMVKLCHDERGAHLVIRNLIFRTVFDYDWVKLKQTSRFLADSLRHWLEFARNESHLLRGDALQRALDWSKNRTDLTHDEETFLRECLALKSRDDERAQSLQLATNARWEAERRTQIERRSARRIAVIALLLLVALIGAGVSERKRKAAVEEAEKQRGAAVAAEVTEEAARKSAEASEAKAKALAVELRGLLDAALAAQKSMLAAKDVPNSKAKDAEKIKNLRAALTQASKDLEAIKNTAQTSEETGGALMTQLIGANSTIIDLNRDLAFEKTQRVAAKNALDECIGILKFKLTSTAPDTDNSIATILRRCEHAQARP